MSIATYNLTVRCTGGGEALPGATVEARLTRPDYTADGGNFPISQRVTADENGIAVLALVSNLVGTQDSRYNVVVRTATGQFLDSREIQMPEADSTLAQLVEELPVNTDTQTAAAISAALAEKWATGTEPGGAGTQSAREWADVAASSADSITIGQQPEKLPRNNMLALGVEPLRDVVVEELVGGVAPLDVLSDGRLYGANGNWLYVSENEGQSWSLVVSNPGDADGQIRAIRDLGDGEVLVSSGGTGSAVLVKSSGWQADPTAATWNVKLASSTVGESSFRDWGVKTYPEYNKCAAADYDGNYDSPPGAWVSDDDGETWTSVVGGGQSFVEQPFHFHGIERDQWNNWRVYLATHPGPGNQGGELESQKGTYYTDDNGATWYRVPWDELWEYDEHEGQSAHPDPTVIHAMEGGVILGSDQIPNGVWRIPRLDDNDPNFKITPLLIFRDEAIALNAVARESRVSPVTGIMYMSFTSVDPSPAHLVASNGSQAWIVWQADSTDLFLAGADQFGRIIGRTSDKNTNEAQQWRADEPLRGSPSGLNVDDPGNVMGGVSGRANTSVAVGRRASVVDGGLSPGQAEFGGVVAVGYRSEARGRGSTALGTASYALVDSEAVGYRAEASRNGVAIGYRAKATHQEGASANAVVIGTNSDNLGQAACVLVGAGIALPDGAHSSVVIGVGASATRRYGTAVGRGAKAGENSVAIGSGGAGGYVEATGKDSVAIGKGAEANINRTTAIGQDAKVTAGGQVVLSPGRVTTPNISPATPGAGHGSFGFRDNDGTQEMWVRFSNGQTKVIADDTA